MEQTSASTGHTNTVNARIAVGPKQGRKVFTLRTLLDCRPDNPFVNTVGKVAGFSLHAGVATRAHDRDQLERLCRYITRPAVSTKRLSLTRHGKVCYELKTPYSDGTTHILFEPLDFMYRMYSMPRAQVCRGRRDAHERPSPASLPWYPGPESISPVITAYLHPIASFERW